MVKIRSSMQWLGAGGSACLVLVGVGFYLDDPGLLDVAIATVGVLLVGFWLTTPLKIGPEEIVIRPAVRARSIPRSDIVGTEVVNTHSMPSWQVLRLLLADGSGVTVDRVAQLRDGGAVDRARRLLAD